MEQENTTTSSRSEKLRSLRKYKEEAESIAKDIEATIRALEDEEVAEVLRASEEASRGDYELPTVGWVARAGSIEYCTCTKAAAHNWLGDADGEVEPVVLKSAADAAIRELSDMVISLSETQAGSFPFKYSDGRRRVQGFHVWSV
jgi:hypothetical protein